MIKRIIYLCLTVVLVVFFVIPGYWAQDKETRKGYIRNWLIIGVVSIIVGYTFRTVQIKFWNNVEEETTQQQTIEEQGK